MWRHICTAARRLKVIIPVHLFFFPQLYYFRIHLSDREEPIHKKKERKEEAGDDDDDEDDEGKLNSSFSRHVASEALD